VLQSEESRASCTAYSSAWHKIICKARNKKKKKQKTNLVKTFDSCSEMTDAASTGLPGLTRGEQMGGI